jgi:hypothetical protein
MRDWDFQTYWHNGQHLCLLETNRRTGETLVAFSSNKWRFMQPELRAMVLAVVLNGEPLYGLLDYLMELEGFANAYDRTKFRAEVETAMDRLAVPGQVDGEGKI